MSKRSEAVKRWRINTKKKMVEAFGGKCCMCGYDRCISSLDFHHLDPSTKEFGLGSIRGNPKSWEKIINELKKCVCVCKNCHSEIHSHVSYVPEDAPRFNEEYINYDTVKQTYTTRCPVCNELKPEHQKFCSRKCVGLGRPFYE